MEKKLIIEYINNIDLDTPIFTNDVKKYVYKKLNIKENKNLNVKINIILNNLKKDGIIKNAEKGIYYKPRIGVFGESTLGNSTIRYYKYIEDVNGNIKGYMVGVKLFNLIGFTTQMSNIAEIITNKCKYKKFYDEKYNAYIMKPKIEITNENWLYLQLLDILENKENVYIEITKEEAIEIIYEIINKNKLEFEKLIYYANITRNRRALNKLINLARERV